ncbi:MAG TPA: SPOR domain-containing protein [Steroidobacteraceae bacterium]|nr:SPOR domain-containing protein [Steroidobacteraceae bacterium]
MAKDYKPRRARTAQIPAWNGFFLGLAVGLAIAGAVYLQDRRPKPAAAQPQRAQKARQTNFAAGGGRANGEAAGAAASAAIPAKSYDFYRMLPNFEVVLPAKGKEVKADLRPAAETRPGTYILQAGSYKHFADADRVRAQLALQGIESKVQKVSVDNDTWHRIRIGPVSNLDALNRMRRILRKANIDVLVIRVGD